MKIGIVQMKSIILDIEENFKGHERIIEKSTSYGKVDIFCFPEGSFTGYSIDKSEKICLNEIDKKMYLDKFLKLSNKHDCLILFGLFEKVDGEMFISHYGVSNEEISCYRKIHLGSREQEKFSEGTEIKVFSYKNIKYGIQLCYDLHFPEMSIIQKIKGANIIFAPHAVPGVAGNRKKIWSKYVCARAYDNSVYVACCNQVGSGENKFSGGSVVVSNSGDIVSEFYENEENVLIFDYDFEKTKVSKKKEFFLNRKPKYYDEILKEAIK